jgi:ATP-dependent DNA helicase RecG
MEPMTREKLLEILSGFEWNDVEFKEAARDVPREAFPTVSAFSNTSGGWLIFGVKEANGKFEIIGVIDVDKVQGGFLTALRNPQRISKIVTPEESHMRVEDKVLLIFYIPEARRQDKPIYLGNDLNRSYVRKGSSDMRCSEEELRRFIRDASSDPFDRETIQEDITKCYNFDTLHWYRENFNRRNPGYNPSIPDLDFLQHWGYIIDQGGVLLPTRASLLLFGTQPIIIKHLPRMVVDCQWINASFDEEMLEQRWDDRLVCEDNLFNTWRFLADFYLRHAERPFRIEGEDLQRQDLPADYIAFREACINLLIHQDYGDYNRKASIRFYKDRLVLSNPGDAFAFSLSELLEPGEKEIRNPTVVSAFRRIGLSEQAGTGIRAIFNSWNHLDRVPPEIINDKARKSFEICLLKEPLMTEEQILFQASLGVKLSPEEAEAFALVCRKIQLPFVEIKALTGSTRDAQQIVEKLQRQRLIEVLSTKPQPHIRIAEHLLPFFDTKPAEAATQPLAATERLVSEQPAATTESLVSEQPRPLRGLNDIQWRVVHLCDVPRSMQELLNEAGISSRQFFRNTYLEPLIQGGIIRMTYPDIPNHPRQTYVLTEDGVRLKSQQINGV